jgi:hypothetical protein
MDKEEFRQALWQGGNPEGQYDLPDEDKLDVLVELGLAEYPPEPEPTPPPKATKKAATKR